LIFKFFCALKFSTAFRAVQRGFAPHPVSYAMATGGPVSKRPVHEVDY
jgi:hypothetical protein